ncbi:DUF1707 and FHA domain-containing protein [Kitasatospora sp. NPDC097643]|uniref:DUF1707 and FHA domain-containing protein n=1 Tax=Kitasatospora sp. NPDC097643 TaxID=3157230 RepID=UPI00332FA120
MTPPEIRPGAVRPSDAERDQALEVLRDGAGNGRLSHETFLGRMELVLHATSRGELDEAMTGLPTGKPFERFVLRAVGRVSAFGDRLNRAWRTERLPGLSLPDSGAGQLTIGRIPGSGLRLHDASVSRQHAELRHENGGWVLYDLGSTNGTHVNGRRIAGGVRVRAGDQVRFGNLEFRLASD